MQDIEEGFVVGLEGDFAKVHVAPHAGCENCKMCDAVNMTVLAYNPLKAAQGEKVKFTMANDNMMRISFMLFLLPLLAVFAGIYTGSVISAYSGINDTAAMISGALCFFIISIAVIYLYDKKYRLNKKNFPQIIEVIK